MGQFKLERPHSVNAHSPEAALLEIVLVDLVGEVAYVVDAIEDEVHGAEELVGEAADTAEKATARVGACVEAVWLLQAQRSRHA